VAVHLGRRHPHPGSSSAGQCSSGSTTVTSL
jgi:hypothetical protein